MKSNTVDASVKNDLPKSLFHSREFLRLKIAAIALSSGCGSPSMDSDKIVPEKVSVGANAAIKATANLAQVTTKTTVQTDTSTGVADLNLTGPGVFLLNSKVLKSALLPIFGTTPRSGRTESLAGTFFTSVPDEYFTPDEKEMLGDYEVLSGPNKAKKRMGPRIGLSQDYMFALRTFASNACHKLVEAEFANPQRPENILVKAAESGVGASPQTISDFMSMAFTYAPPQGVHAGAAKFSEIMATNVSVASAADKPAALKNNYKLVCVYVVTDPRTFTR